MGIDHLAPFADAEDVVRRLLVAELAEGVRVVSATGPTITPPTVLARRVGGDCDYVTDYAIILISCFCATRPESSALAATVQAVLLNAVNTPIVLDDESLALIDGIVVMVADHPESYENLDLRHVSATFELRMRRPRLPAI